MSLEIRRAPASFALHDSTGTVTAEGQSQAVIDDDGLSVGSITVQFLDADALWADDYAIDIKCWPSGRLVLNQLGRRYDTFRDELSRTRNQARIAGLLAHGVSLPLVFPAAIVTEDIKPVECHLFHTHLTLVPEQGDPWQLPLGTIKNVEIEEEPPSVVLRRDGPATVIGQLGRRRDEFSRALEERRQTQARILEVLTGLAGFADGLGIVRSKIRDFDGLVTRWSAPERTECAATLLKAAKGSEPRFGFVELLDPDAGMTSVAELPEHWASFLLVPLGPVTALEILAGPSAATYIFEGDIEEINRDLQLLHFRRGALALTGEAAEITPANPYRLALRKLEPLKRLRAGIRARVVHGESWSEKISSLPWF